MHAQRFTLTVPDANGRPRCGEVLLAESWQPQLAEAGPPGDAAFRIVILRRPAPPSASVSAPAVAICAPARAVDAPLALREPPAAYVVPGRVAEPAFPVFSAADMATYAEGRILAATPSGVAGRRIFPAQKGAPRLELLAQALLAPPSAVSTTDRFLEALTSAMAAPASPPGPPDAERVLAALRNLVRQAEAGLRRTGEKRAIVLSRAVKNVRAIVEASSADVALAEARCLFVEPLSLAEAIFLCRCLARDAASALDLANMRAYLDAAVIPASAGDLAIDRRVTLEQLSPAVLFVEPHRFDGMRATFEYFRKRFIAAYCEHHRHYWDGCRRLLEQIEESEATARALIRLNAISDLGRPVGLNALAQYSGVRSALAGCPLDDALLESLQMAPACPMCGLTLAAEPPDAAARDVSRRLERALRQQQQRLSGAAIRRILTQQRGERIEQFLQVVQASDLRGLADVLDDDLVAFLRDLLSTPARTDTSALEALLRAYPEVTEDSLEAAVTEFRRLLATELAAQRQSDPTRRPRVVLDVRATSRARK